MSRDIVQHRVLLSGGATVDVWDSGGRNDPPLVLVPGVAGAKEIFARTLPDLAAGRRVLAIDLSRRVPAAAVEAAAGDLEAILDSLDISQADLLGQSFGAIVAVRLWRRRPHAVRRLVLVAPATLPAPREAAPILARWAFLGGTLRLWPRARRAGAIRWIQSRGGYALEPDLSAEELEALFERVKRTPIRPLLGRLWSLRGHSWVREIADVSAPLLVVAGEREWPLVPPAVRRAFETHPDTRIVRLPGGHMPFLTCPQPFARVVREFLERDYS